LLSREKEGLVITSQTKWFFEHCTASIIGVTGTKGKGTTATLISKMLNSKPEIQSPKSQIYLTGNIGAIQPFEILDNLTKTDTIVYELSSFQLQDLTQSPHTAVVLMVTQDHLDMHKNVQEYHAAKEAISKYQSKDDIVVYNADYPATVEIANLSPGLKYQVSRFGEVARGCFVKGNFVICRGLEGEGDRVITAQDAIALRGSHNLENVCAAVTVSLLHGASSDSIQNVLKEFKGLEHRLEFVAEKNKIKFYNDSISTIQDTTIAAIRSFFEPQILILGGAGKNLDFSQMAQEISGAENIKAIVLIGQEAGRIKSEIEKAGGFKGTFHEGAQTMQEAVAQSLLSAEAGDIVLLSPACTSYDMFVDYKDRGKQFKSVVLAL
jgi:UDP-N-acetylmuramoylalanine--D-glutamate ligase